MSHGTSAERHLLLFVDLVNGKPAKEPVHVADLGDGRFRLLYSPGLVQGIAAGDEFRLRDEDGRFDVLSRSGNLAVQVFSSAPVGELRTDLTAHVSRLGGRLDGVIERGLAFTVPLAAGFPAIEGVFNRWVAEHPGWEWYFGNVYSTADGVTPLNWWLPAGTLCLWSTSRRGAGSATDRHYVRRLRSHAFRPRHDPLTEQPLAELDERAPSPHVDVGYVHLGNHVEQQQLGELLGVEAVVLALGAEDQPQPGDLGPPRRVGPAAGPARRGARSRRMLRSRG